MKVLFGCFLFIFMSASGYACWAPNCYGAVGFDPKTGQTSAGTDYSTAREAEQALKEDCPSCEYMTFNNSCGTIVYSAVMISPEHIMAAAIGISDHMHSHSAKRK